MRSLHQQFMSRALSLASNGLGRAATNPLVGCVIVKNNRIIAEGYHQGFGQPHAEIEAIANAKESTHNAALYINLEPCNHYGKTPPCCKAIIQARISTVYIADVDPHPLVQGKGIAALKRAGIIVKIGLLRSAAKKLNYVYYHIVNRQLPYISAKWAMSLDGKLITNPGDDRNISAKSTLKLTHKLRYAADAILIGVNTLLFDNPKLTIRYHSKKKPLHKIILAGNRQISKDLNIFADGSAKIFIVTKNKYLITEFSQQSNVIIVYSRFAERKRFLKYFFQWLLKKHHIASILVEGGPITHNELLAFNFIEKIDVIIAPNLIADYTKKRPLKDHRLNKLDKDYVISAHLGA